MRKPHRLRAWAVSTILYAQLYIECADLAFAAKGISTWPHKGTGVACGQFVAIDHAVDRFAFDLWG